MKATVTHLNAFRIQMEAWASVEPWLVENDIAYRAMHSREEVHSLMLEQTAVHAEDTLGMVRFMDEWFACAPHVTIIVADAEQALRFKLRWC